MLTRPVFRGVLVDSGGVTVIMIDGGENPKPEVRVSGHDESDEEGCSEEESY